jgi:hypothetical protein
MSGKVTLEIYLVGTHSKIIFFKQTVNLYNVGSIPTPSAFLAMTFGGVEMLVLCTLFFKKS